MIGSRSDNCHHHHHVTKKLIIENRIIILIMGSRSDNCLDGPRFDLKVSSLNTALLFGIQHSTVPCDHLYLYLHFRIIFCTLESYLYLYFHFRIQHLTVPGDHCHFHHRSHQHPHPDAWILTLQELHLLLPPEAPQKICDFKQGFRKLCR